jgi:hypothetical protein
MTAHKHGAQAQAMIESLLPEMTEIVEGINAQVSTTQDNYGAYMSTLSALVPDSDRVMLYVIAEALRQAGGSDRGIASALRIIAG